MITNYTRFGRGLLICGVLGMVSIGTARGDSLGHLNDEFEDGSKLGDWTQNDVAEGWASHWETWDIDGSNAGKMTVMPYSSSWFGEYVSGLAYKKVSGDFAITTEVSVTNRAGDGLPTAAFSLAGLMIRKGRPEMEAGGPDAWTPGGENYLFLALGYASAGFGGPGQPAPGPGPHFERKSTTNSSSSLVATQNEATTAQLQIARVGDSVILMYKRPQDTEWQVHWRYDRPDMAGELQVGMHAYTNWPEASSVPAFEQNTTTNDGPGFNPDLIAQYEYARFARVELPDELVGVDLVGDATDEQLLSFLGESLSQPVPEPSAVALMGMGAWMCIGRRNRRRME
ncbi:hypothetical protein KS4_12930 [Poriferisphaera corsica]|uniref:Ice-binding protein C-terminal domain-containing protein n=1 Tax=Poriferisphaera corsica TaxID=2528020 RepID=A0A517YSR5_9BACT|nr:PEP-CTERM sorting domain-containing protein [Poriferisphaera corsica]QDU33248.1 hypothetical protein KS4_12930 [Poriferisphaera corsica]